MNKIILTALVAVFALTSLPAYAVEGVDGEKAKKAGVLAKYDKNGDGLLSKGEYSQMTNDRFEKIDVNNDGNISREEAKAHRKQRVSHLQERRANKGAE